MVKTTFLGRNVVQDQQNNMSWQNHGDEQTVIEWSLHCFTVTRHIYIPMLDNMIDLRCIN